MRSETKIRNSGNDENGSFQQCRKKNRTTLGALAHRFSLIPKTTCLSHSETPSNPRQIAWNTRMIFMPVIARSVATKQSSWIAAIGFASLAMTNGGAFIQQQSEESSWIRAFALRTERRWILRFPQPDRGSQAPSQTLQKNPGLT